MVNPEINPGSECPTCRTNGHKRCPIHGEGAGSSSDTGDSSTPAGKKESYKIADSEIPHKRAAIEIFIYNPTLGRLPQGYREMQENPRLKARFSQYLSVGVYFDQDSQALKYYAYSDRYTAPPETIKTYASLAALAADLPETQKEILLNQPKLFLIAHGNGGIYGLCGDHYDSDGQLDDSEKILGLRFDQLIENFKQSSPTDFKEKVITLEGCNVANRQQGRENKDFHNQSFLENLSENHRDITFCGSAPWNPTDALTGVRAQVNLPITSMTGSVWKSGNWVVFYNDTFQVVAKKSVFASTTSVKEVKINTIKYAKEALNQTTLSLKEKESLLKNLALSPDILTIDDLAKIPDFLQGIIDNDAIRSFAQHERNLLKQEKDVYIEHVKNILLRSDKGEDIKARDSLILALVLKNPFIFDDNEALKDQILSNKSLLQSVMVTCGKILIAGPDNDNNNDQLIDLLISQGIDINTPDADGKTALHYAAHFFYFYNVKGREREPLQLVRKLIASGANLEAKDNAGRTPAMLAIEFNHSAVVKVLEEHRVAFAHDQKSASFDNELSSADRATLDLSVRSSNESENPGQTSCLETISGTTHSWQLVQKSATEPTSSEDASTFTAPVTKSKPAFGK